MPEADLMNIDTVCKFIGGNRPLNKATIWRWVQAGNFPQPIRFGRTVRWFRSEIESFMEKVSEARYASDEERPQDNARHAAHLRQEEGDARILRKSKQGPHSRSGSK